MNSPNMAPGAPSASLGSAHGDAAQLLGFQEQLLATEQLPYTAGERGRSRQRSAPAADSGMHPSDALGNGFLGGSQLGSAGYAIGSHAPRSASAPPGRMQLGAAGGATDPALAQLQRAQQELQRQRDEQSQWAAAAQQLLRSHGHGLPQSTSPQDPQQRLPPLPSPGGVPRRPASLDLQPSNDLCRTFASLQADLGVIDQRQHDWEARWAAHQAGLAQEQSQWETRRAAEQWSWEMRRQAEEQAWRQARQQQEEAWLEKRRQEEREWLDKRRREEQEQREARQRAEQQWQRECQALQLQQQQVTVEVRQLPQVGAAGRPAFALPQGKPPASYSGGGNGEGASGSGSGTSGSGSCGLPPPPLPAVLEGDSMQMDLLSFDSFDFMEMARELGLASPMPSLQVLSGDPQQAQQRPRSALGALRNPGCVPQPFSPLPVQQPVGSAPGQPLAAGLEQQAQRAQRAAGVSPASF